MPWPNGRSSRSTPGWHGPTSSASARNTPCSSGHAHRAFCCRSASSSHCAIFSSFVAVARPTRCGTVPTVVLDGHVDAAVDEELHRLVRVRQEDEMVQDARRLVRAPIGVDVCAVLEQEVRHVEVAVDDGKGERHIEHLLHASARPTAGGPRALRRRWRDSDSRHRPAPARRTSSNQLLHPREVAHARRMRQIVR